MIRPSQAPSFPAPQPIPDGQALLVKPIAGLPSGCQFLEDTDQFWGIHGTPAHIRLRYQSGSAWKEDLQEPKLLEARIFNEDLDFHWLNDRGVLLKPMELAASGEDSNIAHNLEWYRRRRSRFWGEWLEGTQTWYEQRIPDPIHYPVEPGPEHRVVFLHFHEYIQNGRVAYIRYYNIEGAAS